jgi:hypothetical protein
VVKKDEIVENIKTQSQAMGFEDGFSQGMTVGQKKAREDYASSLDELKGYLLSQVLMEKDLLIPPKVQRIYTAGESDGTHFTPPRVEYVIVEPARFNIKRMVEFTKSSEWGWIMLRQCGSNSEALREAGGVKKHDPDDHVDVMPGQDGATALMVRVKHDKLGPACGFYKQQYPGAAVAN